MSNCCDKGAKGLSTPWADRVRCIPKRPKLLRSLPKALLLIVAPFWALSATSAATISDGVDEYGNHYLTLNGPIVLGDPSDLPLLSSGLMLAGTSSMRCVSTRPAASSGKPWPWP